MAIIRYSKDSTIRYAYLNIFPDQFKTEKEKQDAGWQKNTMDYFANQAYYQFTKARETFVHNYDLLKGIINRTDFYQEDADIKSFSELLEADLSLPSYVKHYSIMTTPINELVGEISKRPDLYKIKACDDDSKAEELQYKTQLLQDFVIGKAKQKILEKAQMEGMEIDEEQLTQLSMEQVKDELANYTSVAERWGNKVLTCQKTEFNLKEKSEETFRDLLVSAREFYLIDEDNSKTGYNIEVINPKNQWHLSTPDKKYISDVTGRAQGAYAAGTVHVMELSEIIEMFPDITKEEIDHLRSSLQDYGLINVRESNLGRDVTPGQETVQYDTYDPLVLQTRMMIESEMKDNHDELKDWLGLTSNVSSFGYKYVVVRAYWISKKKIGKVGYIDEMGNEQAILVDETYKSGEIPTQISLEWGWINQWYKGVKIGPDVYYVKPFNLLPYCPLIGTVYEIKNTDARSLVDLMKPFQVIYNICLNQLYSLLEKEIGNVASINIRRIPKVKDGDDQDAIDIWEMDARQRGIVFDDDSPENTKAPVSNTSVAKNIDLTRTQEIQSRYNLAVQMKNECWELVGMSKQRMGSVSPSESATGTNAAITQSYSQTEPLFVAHEYVLGQLYQAIVDASLYIESSKPYSTLSYITSEGDSAFVQVNGSDLRFRDLKVFPTNRPEDTRIFNELRQLSQAVIQNGGTLYDVIELYSTNSLRQMKKTFKDLRDRQIALQDQAAQQKQQELEQQREIAQATLQQAQNEKQADRASDSYERALDRVSKEKIAIIQAESKGVVPDIDNNKVPDALEISKLSHDQDKASKEFTLKMAEIQSNNAKVLKELEVKREALQVDRDNQKNDLQIAKLNVQGRKAKK